MLLAVTSMLPAAVIARGLVISLALLARSIFPLASMLEFLLEAPASEIALDPVTSPVTFALRLLAVSAPTTRPPSESTTAMSLAEP